MMDLKTNSSDKHQFAIYCDGLSEVIAQHPNGGVTDITNDNVVTRVRSILRLEPGETIILFNDSHNLSATLVAIKKSSMQIKINAIKQSLPLEPSIHMLLPILKRDAMEQSLMAMSELGVTTIQPITTAKSQRSHSLGIGGGDSKDHERAKKIMRAAAEQSKQFVIPKILPTVSLDEALMAIESFSGNRLFLDASGMPLATWLKKVDTNHAPFSCLVGPEGDFTAEEKDLILKTNFSSVQLTPTILRSWQAAFLGVGIIRSYI